MSEFYKLIHVVERRHPGELYEEDLELFGRASALGAEAEIHDRSGKLLARYTAEEVKHRGDLKRAVFWGEKFPQIKETSAILPIPAETILRSPEPHRVEARPQVPFKPARLVVDEAPEGTMLDYFRAAGQTVEIAPGPISAEAFRWDAEEKAGDLNWPLMPIGSSVQFHVLWRPESFPFKEGVLATEARFAAHFVGSEYHQT